MNGRDPQLLPLESQKSFAKLGELKAPAFLHQHANAAGYLLRPEARKAAADENFTSNNGLWEAVLYARVHAEKIVRLDSFFLFEWVPRAPGLWWTPEGRKARRKAEQSIAGVEDGVVIYQPWGKASMLEGGIGNLRLVRCVWKDARYISWALPLLALAMKAFRSRFPHRFTANALKRSNRATRLHAILSGDCAFFRNPA